MPRFSCGQASCAAMITPTSIPTTPHNTAARANSLTTVSLYTGAAGAVLFAIGPLLTA